MATASYDIYDIDIYIYICTHTWPRSSCTEATASSRMSAATVSRGVRVSSTITATACPSYAARSSALNPAASLRPARVSAARHALHVGQQPSRTAAASHTNGK